MSSNRPYFTPYHNWSNGEWHDPTNSHGPEHNNRNRWQPIFPRPSPPPEIPQNPSRFVHDPYGTFAVPPRVTRDEPSSNPNPGQPRRRLPRAPVRVLVHNDDAPRRASYPRPSQLPFDSPPPWFIQSRETSRDESKLTPNEQKEVLNKLKKEIYNPVQSKVAKQVGLYFRGLNNNINNTTTNKTDKDEDSKRCSICLEDFVAKEMVTVTPCSHMFHEDCIIPWVKNHGSCPVCRFAICERMKQDITDSSAPRTTGASATNPMLLELMMERDLISVMRAFDETFELDQMRSILLPRLTRR